MSRFYKTQVCGACEAVAMVITGTFEVSMQAEPPYEDVDGVAFARVRIDKRFVGPLTATSALQMLSARGPVKDSAAYVALERVRGTLDGKAGTFAFVHLGLMNRGVPSLTLTVVPDSGTGELEGLQGHMAIDIVGGQHHYRFDYRLPGDETVKV